MLHDPRYRQAGLTKGAAQQIAQMKRDRLLKGATGAAPRGRAVPNSTGREGEAADGRMGPGRC